MRRLLLYISLFFAIALQPVSAQQLDSLTRANLSRQLNEYFAAIETSGVEVQIEESDFLIGMPTDSLVRQFVAVKVYEHYLNSPVMGSETVAIHVLDEWFLSGKVKMYNDIDFLNARIFADFNRQSLIGSKAPQLTLLTRTNEQRAFFDEAPEAYKILYFYDAGCAKCKLETPRLVRFLATGDYPVELLAVYAGDSANAWDEYVAKYFSTDQVCSAQITHLWDPEIDSDFQRKYGVLQTPRMFLIAPDGTIIGRGLDTIALEQLLEKELAASEFQYGSPESEQLFDKLLGPAPTADEIMDIAQMLAAATIDKNDVKMFKQLTGDYLYYLAPKSGEEYKEGLYRMVNQYVLSRNEIWTTEDDRLKVVGFSEILNDLLSKAQTGSLISDIKVKGEYIKGTRSSQKKKSFRKLGGDENLIIFHTEGCHICAAQIAAASELAASNPKVRVFLVNVDRLVEDNPTLSATLFDSFDLSALPYILLIDKKGTILRRYIYL